MKMHHPGHGHHHRKHQRHGAFEGMSGRFDGKRRERVFEQGDLKLVVLYLLQQQPRHGYEVIKSIQELTGGEYSPSPGIVYPTLTLLEELEQASVTEQNGKKQYSITAEGEKLLLEQESAIAHIMKRLNMLGSFGEAKKVPELRRSMQNLKMALQMRLERGQGEQDVIHKIVDIMDKAAKEIERS